MYIVTLTSNYDPDVKAVTFETREIAENYLQWWWEDFYNDIIANNDDIDEYLTYHEDDYAQVAWNDGGRTFFHLMLAETPDPRFPKERRY